MTMDNGRPTATRREDAMTDQVLFGVTREGTIIELCRWLRDTSNYDADGWLDNFGDRIGSGKARLPTGAWIDLSAFCILRGGEITLKG